MKLPNLDASTVLYIDDEEQARKWFFRTFGAQFHIKTADSAIKALDVLDETVAVVVCDHRMPVQTGMDFLTQLTRSHPGIVRVLTSAYTDKTLLMDAISHSGVAYFIEKPWQAQDVSTKLEQALLAYKRQALLDHSIRNSLTSSKSALGFLAHELNTPLAIVGSYLDMLARGFKQQALTAAGQNPGAQLNPWTNQGGQVFDPAAVVETIQQQIIYTKSMLNASVQAARMALLEQAAPAVYASELVGSVVQRFALIAQPNPKVLVEQDFLLNQSIDLIHLAVCSVVQNAIKAMKTVNAPVFSIVIGSSATEHSKTPIHFIRISDNGTGVPLQVLSNLNARRPSDSDSGAGMGLLFCKRVIESLSGEFLVESHHEQGHTLDKGVSTQVTFLCH